MADDDKKADAAAVPDAVQSIEVDEPVKKEEDAGEGSDNDAPGEDDDAAADAGDGKVSNALYKAYKAVTEVLLNFKIKTKNNEEYFPAGLFKRLPNKRLLPEYYDIIKEPSAISTLRGKIQRKQYTGTPEFVHDFALVVHNAQVFNRPNSQPVRDVLKLEELFKAELQKLVGAGFATEEEIKWPDLGEIPYSTPEPDPVTEEEEDDEDEDDEADDSDDDKRRKRGRKGNKAVGKKGEDDDDEDKAAEAEQKRRGRPPKVATPMEHRIDRILKSLKKPKAANGLAMIAPFERLPDKAELPDYYQVITNPIAFDILKRKAKRKKYSSIEEFMKDVELMFKNAMHYNEDGSDIHRWAQELLEEARKTEAEETAKPDSEYLQAAEGRIPLPHIIYKGDMWKVGDWIHIQNPNDITKPIVAQIYRTWKTENDEEWINACWYYRPEQTVHQYEKHFFPNEVVKTGQYRDHKIEEVLNKCFVMFYTRYSRGRPRNLAADIEVYVCEARYNEDKMKFNKIKTWASCLPDEVRDKDYEMDLFETPRKVKKVPSPLLSRLKDDMKATDELPQPEWKHSNAPPLVGGIHKRPREENQSPPPEPTPPPQPAPTPIARTPSVSQPLNMRVPVYPQNGSNVQHHAQPVRPTPSMTPQTSFNTNAAQYSRQTSYTGANQYTNPTQNIGQQSSQQYQYKPQATQPTPLVAAHPGSYNASTPAYHRTTSNNVQAVQYQAQQATTSIPQRTAEAYVLSDAANAAIPENVREQFPRDDQGRVLFFTTPPLDTRHIVSGSSEDEQGRPLEHSEQYQKALAIRKRKHESGGNDDNMKVDGDGSGPMSKAKQAKVTDTTAKDVLEPAVATGKAIVKLTKQINQSTKKEYQVQYGDKWQQVLSEDVKWAEERRRTDQQKDRAAEQKRKIFRDAHLGNLNGQYALNAQGYITGWQKSFFTGTYLDDHDSRLP
ncbi:hypothetical protein OHC33_000891 [Knufia fluminis]|uniref:Uncharacterized protein n=1 Tax=Knufia fluminis TaxID=191047 RepID=A0AAN8ESE6_9EURO|nr:hypothetical protein OHC33_000891 [Knufia fluminis]